jgi:hypothetical protein
MRGAAPERMSTMETMGRFKRPRRSFTSEFKAEVVALADPTSSVMFVSTSIPTPRSRRLPDRRPVRRLGACDETHHRQAAPHSIAWDRQESKDRPCHIRAISSRKQVARADTERHWPTQIFAVYQGSRADRGRRSRPGALSLRLNCAKRLRRSRTVRTTGPTAAVAA